LKKHEKPVFGKAEERRSKAKQTSPCSTKPGHAFTRTRDPRDPSHKTKGLAAMEEQGKSTRPHPGSRYPDPRQEDLMTCLAQDAGFQPLLTQQHYIKSGQLRIESNQVTQHDRQQPKEATLIRISRLLPGRTSTLASLHMQFATESYQGATCNWKEWHPPARQITVDRCISSS
jgi:hypothetical protein